MNHVYPGSAFISFQEMLGEFRHFIGLEVKRDSFIDKVHDKRVLHEGNADFQWGCISGVRVGMLQNVGKGFIRSNDHLVLVLQAKSKFTGQISQNPAKLGQGSRMTR